ncbi:MAG: hypothetical protein ACPGOV_15195 [Magnetovibrionaceae bacterium]
MTTAAPQLGPTTLDTPSPVSGGKRLPSWFRYMPYAVGLFTGVPFVLWGLFQLAGMTGASNITSLSYVALVLASLPLVAWFFLSCTGFLANSIGGRDEFQAPVSRPVGYVIRALPAISYGLGFGTGAWLLFAGEGAGPAILVFSAAILSGIAIRRGERARLDDRQPPAVEPLSSAVLVPLTRTLALALAGTILGTVGLFSVFGAKVLIVAGLIGTVAAFCFMIALCRG